MLHVFIASACFLCLEIVAFINAYVTNLKGATVDAERLMDHAIAWLHHGEFSFVFDAQFYIQIIGVIFSVFGESEFLVAQLNIVALLVACRYFHAICLFVVGRTSAFLTILFMLWPSMVPRATTALREPILILSIVLVCYHCCPVNWKRSGLIPSRFDTPSVRIVALLLFGSSNNLRGRE